MCHIKLTGKMKHTSVRVDEGLQPAIIEFCKANGLTEDYPLVPATFMQSSGLVFWSVGTCKKGQ